MSSIYAGPHVHVVGSDAAVKIASRPPIYFISSSAGEDKVSPHLSHALLCGLSVIVAAESPGMFGLVKRPPCGRGTVLISKYPPFRLPIHKSRDLMCLRASLIFGPTSTSSVRHMVIMICRINYRGISQSRCGWVLHKYR
jgi:hypothetical protein